VTIPLPAATADTGELIGHALRGVERIFREGFRYKKAGVIFIELVPARHAPDNLYRRKDWGRSKRRMEALDRVNRLMGSGTLRYAVEGFTKRWKMRREHLSPRYTSNWGELLRVSA
jgi:DNA polymerase V